MVYGGQTGTKPSENNGEQDFQSITERVPPQNLEAEEAILGSILLDPEAISRVVDVLKIDAFYLNAHREIYRTALMLHGQGKPTDLTTMAAWLQDQGKLDQVGGQSKLAQLLDRIISTANVDQYAELVMDKYLRRQLIKVGNQVIAFGYDTKQPLSTILQESEQKIFALTQDRPRGGLIATAEILTQTFNEIESRSLGTTLSGIPCNFYDLDGLTQGFQRSDLIIVAGRPAMGKCLAHDSEIVLSDGSIQTIAEIYQAQQTKEPAPKLLTLDQNWKFSLTQPSAFVDDGIKPVFKVVTRLGRSIETTLTHPFLTFEGWKPLGQLQVGLKIAIPRIIPIFGEQTLPEARLKILAYLIGDGCLTRTSPQFTNENDRLQADFAEAVDHFPGLRVTYQDSQGTRTKTGYVVRETKTMTVNRQAFAKILRNLMLTHGWSNLALAQKLGCSPSLITLWRQGKSAPNPDCLKELCKLFQIEPQDFGINHSAELYSKEKNILTHWLADLGLWGKDSHTKVIPQIIFQLTKPQIALFLNRLFATDGWITVLKSNQVQLGYASVSKKLVQQIQHLLLRFGVIASLKQRQIKYQDDRRPAWQLDITDQRSLETFIDTIGIFGKEEAVEQARKALLTKTYHTNRDLIPIEAWLQLTVAKGTESWQSLLHRSGIQNSNLHVGKRALSRDRLALLSRSLQSVELENLATSEVYWDQIVSIEPVGYKQVYDLTIPKTHNFVANDICVHNTSFVLNIARNIAVIHRLPVCIYSLEMSKEQLVYRLLSSEVGIESGRLRSGRITTEEWSLLGQAMGNLSELPIYIDDTPDMTVNEMRSKARRLQSEQGGKLGLVLIDYLQLMEGASPDNRVQELSKITRSLKGMARELNAPVMTLSQLSRGVESRMNKRPMMSDLRESGCLTGDTLITLADTGKRVPLQHLIGRTGFEVWAINPQTWKLEKATVTNSFCTGKKPVFRLTTQLGRKIRATSNHKFLTLEGWKRLDELKEQDYIALPRYLGSDAKIAEILDSSELQALAQSDVYWDKIASIEADGHEDVYDLTVSGLHNFVANDIIVHNSIEQDADLIIMLYRDEYYNPDSVDRGLAEVIITKHRNGPVGTVKLLFEPQFTRFRNLANSI